MLVSWNWLQDYVRLEMPVDDFAQRLTMTGLNLESIETVEGDSVIDFEVTSNRPDCLGHIGIAREAAVVLGLPLCLPPAKPAASSESIDKAVRVAIETTDCPHYTARVIRGVKVGPSPDWMKRRLQAVGINSVNNVVDATNYVMLECGQPLHAFDYDKIRGRQIVVRKARAGESIRAIDQRDYPLSAEMCVIADAERPVAVAGVMGGWDTEISDATTTVLLEAATFMPLSVRNTARKLDLHSPSSHRFERALDLHGLDWASRRCCELILQTGGGEVLHGACVAGGPPVVRPEPIRLRLSRIPVILGIEIPGDECRRILAALGCSVEASTDDGVIVATPPTFRRDLTREIDLIEEVARVHGYEQIPEDIEVPLCASARTLRDRVSERVRQTLVACGFYEALTLSFVSQASFENFQPRGERPALFVNHSKRRQDNLLRQSLVPSLLVSRRDNERRQNFGAEFFEIARVYLDADRTLPEAQAEPTMIGLVSNRPFTDFKGVLELLARRVRRDVTITTRPSSVPQFTPGRGAELLLNGERWGWFGELDRSVRQRVDLRDAVSVAELDLGVLEPLFDLTPAYQSLPEHQGSSRDLNFVIDESLEWQRLHDVIAGAAGSLLERIDFGGQYRGQQIPGGKKSYLVTLRYRSPGRNLTSEEVEQAQQAVIAACQSQLGADLRG